MRDDYRNDTYKNNDQYLVEVDTTNTNDGDATRSVVVDTYRNDLNNTDYANNQDCYDDNDVDDDGNVT